MSGLTAVAQDDFAAGILQGSARDMQAGVGAYNVLNGLISDDGDVIKRGATMYFLPTGVSRPITWVWSGVLADTTIVLFSTDQGNLYWTPNGTPTLLAAGAGVFAPVLPAVIGSALFLPNNKVVTRTSGAGGVTSVGNWSTPAGMGTAALHIATIAGRLVVASGNRVAFSEPLAVGSTAPVFVADDFHVLPGGIQITGLFAIQDTLMVFTNHGVWTIANMAYNLTDAAGNIQQALSLLLPDLTLPAEAGLCGWENRVVAVFKDRVAIVDPINAPITLSNSIGPLLNFFFGDGPFVAGQIKVFRDVLFLPIVAAEMASAEGTVLTCRLNRPVQGRQIYYPWTRLSGHAGRHLAFDYYSQEGYGTTLIGGGADGHLSDFGPMLVGLSGPDADGSSFTTEIETRHLPTGQGQPNHLKRIRVRYVGASSSAAPVNVTAAYNANPDASSSSGWVSLGTKALPVSGADLASWWLPVPARARFVRVRVSVSDNNVDNFAVQRIELDVRSAAHAR